MKSLPLTAALVFAVTTISVAQNGQHRPIPRPPGSSHGVDSTPDSRLRAPSPVPPAPSNGSYQPSPGRNQPSQTPVPHSTQPYPTPSAQSNGLSQQPTVQSYPQPTTSHYPSVPYESYPSTPVYSQPYRSSRVYSAHSRPSEPSYNHFNMSVGPYWGVPLEGDGINPAGAEGVVVGPSLSGGIHTRHPYYSYRRPWYTPGPGSLNVDIVW